MGLVLGDDGLELESVSPAILDNEVETRLTITGDGFTPETQVTLIGGGIYEIGATPYPSIYGSGLAMRGGLAYATAFHAFSVVDIHDPSAPRVLHETVGTCGGALTLARGYAYVAHSIYYRSNELCVMELSQPDQPVEVARRETPCEPVSVASSEDALYLACTTGELLVMDLSDPEEPQLVSTLPIGRSFSGVAIRGTLLAFVDAEAGLFTFSLKIPTQPSLLGHEPAAPGWGITLEGNHAYVGTSYFSSSSPEHPGVQVVDVEDPRRPRLMGTGSAQNGVWGLAARDGFVYSANNKKLWIHDARDPRAPVLRYTKQIGTSLEDVTLAGDILAVGDQGSFQLRLFDVSRPEPTGLVHYLPNLGPGEVEGERAYLNLGAGEIGIVDLSVPGRPHTLGCLGAEGNVRTVSGDHLFLSDGENLEIWDVSKVRRPVRLAQLALPGYISDIAVSGATAYVGMYGEGRIMVVDLSRIEAPRIIAEIPPVRSDDHPDHPWTLSVSGDVLVYWLAGQGRFWVPIVDVSDLSAPRRLGIYKGSATDLTGSLVARGDYIYLATQLGLKIVDMSDPEAPFLAAELPGTEAPFRRINWMRNVVLDGDVAVTHGPYGQTVVDVSDPMRPRLAGGSVFDSNITAVKDGFAYLSGGYVPGLQVVQIHPLLPPASLESSGRVTLQVPAGMAPGFYHVRALQPSGETTYLYNSVEIAGESLGQHPLRPGRNRVAACPSPQ